ncbi:MAG: cytochrome c3 family protein [Deltaproteobacteria bacterium]|nr:cytochrome c3 family protein [Deltaproteobacteria bacterium]
MTYEFGNHSLSRPARLSVCAGLLLLALLLPAERAQAQQFSDEDCMVCHEEALTGKAPDGTTRDLRVDVEALGGSVHGELGLRCTKCHEGVDRIPHAKKLTPVDCTSCHRDVREVYRESIHAKANRETGEAEAASCASCHGSHDIRSASDPESTVHHHNLAATCIACHEDRALIERHERMPGADEVQSYVLSVHGRSNVDDVGSKAATCNNCHGWHGTKAVDSPQASVSRQNVAETCAKCHQDVTEVYFESVHGNLARQGNPDVPVCTDCHGEHTIKSHEDRQSTVSRHNIARTCARCHEDPEITERYSIPISTPSTFYRDSVHGKALLEHDSEEAAACQDCHGHHSILGGHDARSSVNRRNIVETCGSCHRHEGIREEFLKSVHGRAFLRGVTEAPVCTDCHGEHTILAHDDPDAPVYATHLAKEVCGRCHDSLVVNRKYGLPTTQVSTYKESYHGLASALGDTTVANCASCHGVHDILPHDEPMSTIHPANLQKTCGTCHPGASPEFASGLIHTSRRSKESALLWWIRKIYILLIVGTIGGMLAHNLLIVVRHIRDKLHKQRGIPYVVRFPAMALAQHLSIMLSFTLLVITGFSLSFPESLFSRLVGTYLGLGEGARSVVHRTCGIILSATMIWHIATILLTRRGRAELGALMIRLQDLKDVFRNIGFHLGVSKKKPEFDRYDYTEKMEYWALLWGVVVMAVTGLLMWFPVWAASNLGLGKAWVDAANVIHSYEAWLATLAIAIWHIFFVVFHPEEYPMSMSWITGKLPLSVMEERHPKELARLAADGKICWPEGPPDESADGPETSEHKATQE